MLGKFIDFVEFGSLVREVEGDRDSLFVRFDGFYGTCKCICSNVCKRRGIFFVC